MESAGLLWGYPIRLRYMIYRESQCIQAPFYLQTWLDSIVMILSVSVESVIALALRFRWWFSFRLCIFKIFFCKQLIDHLAQFRCIPIFYFLFQHSSFKWSHLRKLDVQITNTAILKQRLRSWQITIAKRDSHWKIPCNTCYKSFKQFHCSYFWKILVMLMNQFVWLIFEYFGSFIYQ